MKNLKVFLIFLIFLTANSVTFAQKIGVVDTNYILSKMPQYTEAQARLEEQIEAWKTELQTLQAEYDAKKAAFENEKVLLVGEQLKQREAEVKNLDKKIKKFIAEKNLSAAWTHVYQTKEDRQAEEKAGIPGYRQLYDIFKTPTFYLLDQNKRILAKQLTLEQFDALMDSKKR